MGPSLLLLVLAATARLGQAAVLPLDMGRRDSAGCASDSGQMYCHSVGAITYSNLGRSGSYNEVTGMDMDAGTCTWSPVSFSGPLAPFDQPLSIHFRGPVWLKQAHVYLNLSQANKGGVGKRRNDAVVNRDVVTLTSTDLLTVSTTMAIQPSEASAPLSTSSSSDRAVAVDVTTETVFDTVTETVTLPACPSGTAAQTSSGSTGAPGAFVTVSTASAAAQLTTLATSTTIPTPAQPSTTTSLQGWPAPGVSHGAGLVSGSSGGAGAPSTEQVGYTRAAFYLAEEQRSEGIMFLGNYGGQGSGKWTHTFGNTLSYINDNATGGADKATLLANTTVGTGLEFSIFSDEPCDESCGYLEDGTVGYKGFGPNGVDKAFLFEFAMPHDYSAAADAMNSDMPALWLLNARIPYTGQYSACNCWASGCGELDVFEVLRPRADKCKSTVHLATPGGDDNYFARPTAATVKMAVLFDGRSNAVVMKMLPDDAVFGAVLAPDVVDGILAEESAISGLGISAFALGGGAAS